MRTTAEPMVSAQWLAEHLDDPSLRIFDATYHLPATARNAADEFPQKHIPYARFFDIDQVADADNPLPHMLPRPEAFAEAVEGLGMGSEHHAVVYDTHGLMSAGRLWWMFRVFGHDRVSVLDGGLPAWIAAGGRIETGLPQSRTIDPPVRFMPIFRPELVRSREQVATASTQGSETILDARGAARFAGTAPEPRAGVRQGHIPGSISVPYTGLLDAKGCMLPPLELRSRFAGIDLDGGHPIVASCGSGVTACVIALALATLGRYDTAVYDGSWSEWGADVRCPIASAC